MQNNQLINSWKHKLFSLKKEIAFIAALSAFIGVFENLIPSPVPFFKIGFSNIPVCISFAIFHFPEVFFISIFKLIITHLFRGSLFSYPFLIGLSGNLLFITLTYPIYRLLYKKISFISVCIIGSFLHNIGQTFFAFLFLPSKAVIYMGMLLVILGFISGIITGIITNKMYSKYLQEFLNVRSRTL